MTLHWIRSVLNLYSGKCSFSLWLSNLGVSHKYYIEHAYNWSHWLSVRCRSRYIWFFQAPYLPELLLSCNDFDAVSKAFSGDGFGTKTPGMIYIWVPPTVGSFIHQHTLIFLTADSLILCNAWFFSWEVQVPSLHRTSSGTSRVLRGQGHWQGLWITIVPW